jgi:plasmid stabilization system protein ParE
MEQPVQYTTRARFSLRRIFSYIALNAHDDEEYATATGRIIDELEKLAVSPFLGIQIKGHPAEHRYWLIVNKHYRVYYWRLDPTHIVIVQIRGVKQKPLTDEEVERFFTLPPH